MGVDDEDIVNTNLKRADGCGHLLGMKEDVLTFELTIDPDIIINASAQSVDDSSCRYSKMITQEPVVQYPL